MRPYEMLVLLNAELEDPKEELGKVRRSYSVLEER